MLAVCHTTDDAAKCHDFILLAAQERVPLKEGNDLAQQIRTLADDQYLRPVVRIAVILPDEPTVKFGSNQV